MRHFLKEKIFKNLKLFLRFLSFRYSADFRCSRLVFSSDYNPHTDRSTFLTILTILKSYNSYLANLKYWRKSLRSSIFTSSKKLKSTKGYALFRVFSALWDSFFEKIFNVSKGSPLRVFSIFATEFMLINPKGSLPPSTFFGTMRLFLKEFFPKITSFFFQKNFFALFDFWAFDMAPTLDVLVVFIVQTLIRFHY